MIADVVLFLFLFPSVPTCPKGKGSGKSKLTPMSLFSTEAIVASLCNGKKQYQRICLEKNKSDVIENGRLIHSKSLNCTHQHNIGLRVPNDLAWPFWLHSSFPFSDLASDELLLNISSNDPTFPFSLSRSDELCPAWWAAASSQGSLLLGPKSLPYFATFFSFDDHFTIGAIFAICYLPWAVFEDPLFLGFMHWYVQR